VPRRRRIEPIAARRSRREQATRGAATSRPTGRLSRRRLLFDAATGSRIRLATPSGGHSRPNGRAPSDASRGAAAVASQALAEASAVCEAGAAGAAPWRHAAERPRLRGTPPTLLCDQPFIPPLTGLSAASTCGRRSHLGCAGSLLVGGSSRPPRGDDAQGRGHQMHRP